MVTDDVQTIEITEAPAESTVHKPVTFPECAAAIFVLVLLALWIAVFRRVKRFL